jgi:hypothetical protein
MSTGAAISIVITESLFSWLLERFLFDGFSAIDVLILFILSREVVDQ